MLVLIRSNLARAERAFQLAVFLTLFLGFASACTPAVVTAGNCSVDDPCPSGQTCVDGVCQDGLGTPCLDDSACSLGQTCVNGYCSSVGMVDAGADEEAGTVDDDAGSVVTGGGVIQVDNELPIDFGSPLFGAEVQRNVTLRNVGEGPLHIYRVERASGTSAEFSLQPEGTDVDTILQPDWTVDVRIKYTLADGEADVGEILVVSDAEGCSGYCDNPQAIQIPLYSEFKGARNLLVTPASHDFGFVEGLHSSLFAPFSLSNDGTLTKVLTVSAMRIEGVNASDFEILAENVTDLPYYLTPAAEQIVRVRYKPADTAFHTAELIIESNSDDPAKQELHVPLAGRSVPAAELTVAPSLDFGEVEIGQHAERSTTIVNGGGMAATIANPTRFASDDQGFSFVSPLLPITIAPGEQATVTLRFTPLVEGALSDTIMFDHDADNSPLEIALTGSGKAPPQGYSSLRIVQTFSTADYAGSACILDRSNYQNVDLKMTVGGLVCDKDAGGCTGDVCACNLGNYGSATWTCSGSGSAGCTGEAIGNFGSGNDGNFDVSAYYFDDCAGGYCMNGECSAATLQPLCSMAGIREACFPYEYFSSWYPDNVHISETQCLYGVAAVPGRCYAHEATKVRTVIYLSSGTAPDQTLHFCSSLSQTGSTEQVARIVRQEGLFNVQGALGSTQQITASAPCE